MIRERRQRRQCGKEFCWFQFFVGEAERQLFRQFIKVFFTVEDLISRLLLSTEHRDIEEELFHGSNPFRCLEAQVSHGADHTARAQEEEETREELSPAAGGQHNLHGLRNALLLLDFQISQVLSGKVQPRPFKESNRASIQHNPSVFAARLWRQRAALPELCTQRVQDLQYR